MASKENTKFSLAKYPVNNVEYVWKVERYLIEEDESRCYHLEVVSSIASPTFLSPSYSGSDTKVDWKLELMSFPVYDNSYTGIEVTRSLNLCMYSADKGRFKVNILLSFQGKRYHQIGTMTLGRGNGEYEIELMKDEQLSPKLSCLSRLDEVIFGVKISYFKEVCHQVTDNFGTEPCSSCAEPHNLCATLLSDPTLSDVTLKVQGSEFKCHKVILSAASPVFRATFQSDMREKSENLVEIEGLDPEVVHAMIKYIYTGKVSNLDELAADLFVAADRYKLDKLKALSLRHLVEQYEISIADAPKLLVFADLFSIDKLKTKVVQFILDNLDEVRVTKDWKTLVQKDANLLNLILDQVASEKKKKKANENWLDQVASEKEKTEANEDWLISF